MSHVYLIHVEPRYRHAGHYAGYTTRDDVFERFDEHRSGRGAVMLRAAVEAGCVLMLARVWRDVPRRFELALKKTSQVGLCPICSGMAAFGRMRVNSRSTT